MPWGMRSKSHCSLQRQRGPAALIPVSGRNRVPYRGHFSFHFSVYLRHSSTHGMYAQN